MVTLHFLVLSLLLSSAHCRRLGKVAARVKDQIEGLTSEIHSLQEIQSDSLVRVLLGPDAEEVESSCFKTCVGDTGEGETEWEDIEKEGKILTRIDISACRFTSSPIITTALSGDGHHDKIIGVSAPFELTNSGFIVNLLGETVTGFEDHRNPIDLDKANRFNWHIFWIAVGNTC